MKKEKLKNIGYGILGVILVMFGIGWYLWNSFPRIGNLTNLQSLGILVQGAIGIIVVLIGIVLILVARD